MFFPKLNCAEISWVKYYRTKGAEFFYNPGSIRKSEDLREVNVFVLSNYVFQTNSGEKSVLVRQRLDCNRGRYKILAFKSFAKKNGKGKIHISDLMNLDLIGNEIKVGQHCFGCTAGQGSSCSGALKN